MWPQSQRNLAQDKSTPPVSLMRTAQDDRENAIAGLKLGTAACTKLPLSPLICFLPAAVVTVIVDCVHSSELLNRQKTQGAEEKES